MNECLGKPELEENIRKLEAVNARLAEHQLDSQPTNTSTASPSVVLADAPAIPELLGRYQLVEALGRGGNARVWKAYDPDLRRYVAVKFPRGTVAGRPGCLRVVSERSPQVSVCWYIRALCTCMTSATRTVPRLSLPK